MWNAYNVILEIQKKGFRWKENNKIMDFNAVSGLMNI